VGSGRAGVDASWLIRMYVDCGLSRSDAERASAATIRRFAKRRPLTSKDHGAERTLGPKLRRAMTGDPLRTLFRFVGEGEEGLPLVDKDTGLLSEPSIQAVLEDAGLDSVVAMAYAKVVAFAYTPADLYRPIWVGLGQPGTMSFDVLRRLDWSSIFPPDDDEEDLAGTQTVPTVAAAKPKTTQPRIIKPGKK
jgi:hypothetical protein